MSDTFEGPGWWLASDGKWYPPERHPDEHYRQQFVPAPQAAPDFPSVELHNDRSAAQHGTPAASPPTTPFTELSRSNPGDGAHTAETSMTAHVAETQEMSGGDLETEMERVVQQRAVAAAEQARVDSAPPEQAAPPNQDPPAQEPATQDSAKQDPASDVAPPDAQTEIPTFSVASTAFTEPSVERPTFEDTLSPAVVEPPARTRVGRTELEIDRPNEPEVWRPSSTPKMTGRADSDTHSAVPMGGTLASADVSASIQDTSHSIVPFDAAALNNTSTRDQIVASIVFLSGIALIVGTFINWTVGDLVQTGWERGDGIVTVVAGVIGSSMAGPIFVGFRHNVPRVTAIVAGLASGVVLGLVAFNSVLASNASGVDFGAGFMACTAGALGIVIAGIADQS